MLFAYKAKTKEGIIEDVINAADRFAVARDIRGRGSIPLQIREKKDNFLATAFYFLNIFSKVKTSELSIFTKNLSGMLSAGLSLSRAMSVLFKQTKNKTMRRILLSLSAEVNAGGTLSGGLAKFPDVFSKLFVSMARSGEESGNLSASLSEIGFNLEKADALSKKIRGALVYPGVILSAMVVIGVLMFAFVVPTLASTFKELGVTLPTSTRAIVWVGNFFSNNLVLTFVLLLASALGFYTLLRSSFMAKYVDFLIVRLPVIGNMAKELNTARTTRSLASLLHSGVSIVRAVEITEDVVQNIYYKKVLREAQVAVEKGGSFAEVFEKNTHLYPIMMSEMIEVGEETGKLSEMLLNIAVFYENEIENKTKNLSTIIEPVLMIIIGAGVGFFAISMISPLYSILGEIN